MLQLWQVRYVRASVYRVLRLAAKMLFSAVPVAKQNKTLVMSIFAPKGLSVKSRLVINTLDEQFWFFLLPFLECSDRGEMI